MTAVVSRERARATCLIGAAGVLMLAVAFVMMVVAAPGSVHGPAKPSVAQLTTDVGHQLVTLVRDPAVSPLTRPESPRPGTHRR